MTIFELIDGFISNDSINGRIETAMNFIDHNQSGFLGQVADAHLNTAKYNLLSSLNSNNPNLEIRAAINNLILCFNICQQSLRNGKDKIIFGLVTIKWSRNEEGLIRENSMKYASLIALLYQNIGDSINYAAWKRLAVDAVNQVIEIRELSIAHLVDATKNGEMRGSYGYHTTIPDPDARNRYWKEKKKLIKMKRYFGVKI